MQCKTCTWSHCLFLNVFPFLKSSNFILNHILHYSVCIHDIHVVPLTQRATLFYTHQQNIFSLCYCHTNNLHAMANSATSKIKLSLYCSIYSAVTVRLVGGPSRLFGRVVVSLNGEDGTICGRRIRLEDAKVICYMMGYTYVY